jgi:hypothetical protein
MRFLKWRDRPRRIGYVPVDDDEDDEESARGGYRISAEPGAPAMTLTEPIESMRADEFSVSVSPRELLPGRNYLLGGPGEPTCEVVEVAADEPLPSGARRIRRARFRTIANVHPAGTLVTPVTAEYVEDWSQDLTALGLSTQFRDDLPGGLGDQDLHG